ncbi:ATP-binding cassette sub- G member 4 [Bonamia ostreae]|uniref:ATP-binding cassette sub- G member 4 n=1 Tax=Bonamia ostreae TaxID=126728 RepID=A0ABV2AHQ2_9EUKA
MFSKFDDLMVVSAGMIVYNGPADKSMAVFSKMGYPMPENSNPADHYLAVVQIQKNEDIQKVETMAEEYKEILNEIENKEGNEAETVTNEKALEEKKLRTPNFLEQAMILTLKRSLKNYFRTPSLTYVRIVQTVFFALLCGILFFDLGYTESEVIARQGALFFILTNLMFNCVLNVVLVCFYYQKDHFNFR